MNKRIKQLWEDSDAIEVCYPEQGSPVSVSAKTLETFAQLIVRECGVALSPMLRDMISRGQAVELIKKHFGVEE